MMKQQSTYRTKDDVEQAKPGEDMDHLRKMFIGGLSVNTTEDSLRTFYSQWGEVTDVIVMRDPTTKRSRGFGFITYKDPSMVDKAQAARPHCIDGKMVDSKRALPRPEVGNPESNSTVKKVFVGGLKDYHDEQSLTEHFSQFGRVVSVKVLIDKTTGRKRGFAFVEFDDYDSVDKAVLHKNHTIKYVLVDVKKSVYKQELAKKLAVQQQQQQEGIGAGMMVPPGAPGMPSAGPFHQPPYNAQPTTYGYAPVPTAYNGWGGGYAQPPPTAYQQPMATTPNIVYNPYVTPPQGAPPVWNAGAYSTPPIGWPQNGYTPQTAPPAPAAVAPTPVPAASNGWNATAAGTGAQNFGDYQQTYNGGPQKAGSLQGNRMNPYSVSSAPNYGYVNIFDTRNSAGLPPTSTIPYVTSPTVPPMISSTKTVSTGVAKSPRQQY